MDLLEHTTTKICPSSNAREGNYLIGVVAADHTVTMLSTPIRIDANFVAKAPLTGTPEKRFRFAGKCVQHGCKQWDGTKCGVIALVSEMNRHIEAAGSLKPCQIRTKCRWFSQEGAKACELCTFVVTDSVTG